MMRMAKAAQKKGLSQICFTEHIDIDFPGGKDFVFDFVDYDTKFAQVKSAFPKMNIRKGAEAGLEIKTKDKLLCALSGKSFDFIIGSVHLIGGLDPYGSELWEKYEKQRAFEDYLDECIECAKAFDIYDVFGHLGYVSKFCPHEDALMRYGDYREALDELLRILVQKGKGLEVNTSGIRNTGSAMPETPILKRFFELGGEIVTVGSDAHDDSAVGRAVPETLEILKSIGFNYVCAFDERRPRYIKIP